MEGVTLAAALGAVLQWATKVYQKRQAEVAELNKATMEHQLDVDEDITARRDNGVAPRLRADPDAPRVTPVSSGSRRSTGS